MALAPRDDRPLSDQIIDHDLGQASPEQVFKLLVIEIRRLREDMHMLIAVLSPPKSAPKLAAKKR